MYFFVFSSMVNFLDLGVGRNKLAHLWKNFTVFCTVPIYSQENEQIKSLGLTRLILDSILLYFVHRGMPH